MTDRDPERPPEDPTAPPGELVLAEEAGVRVFHIFAPTMADLLRRAFSDRRPPPALAHSPGVQPLTGLKLGDPIADRRHGDSRRP